MNHLPEEFKYSQTHEWALKESNSVVIIGITDYAQQQLGELVFVELPEIGSKISAGDEVCVLESVKTNADVFSPVSGKVIAVNEDLEDAPGLINSDPYQDGWLYKVELKDPIEYDELMSVSDYNEYLDELKEED